MLLALIYLRLIVQLDPFGPEDPKIRRMLVVRGLGGSLGLACFYFALTTLSLADATVIFFTGPIFTAILAYYVLEEPMGVTEIVAGSACLLGVVLVARPPFLFPHEAKDPNADESDALTHTLGVITALVGATMSAVAYVSVRKITKMSNEVHTMVHVFYFGLVSSIFSPIAMFIFQRPVVPVTGMQWLVLLGVGGFAFIGQILLNRGLQLAPAGPGTVMRNLDIVFAFFFDLLLLHRHLEWTSYVGACIILISTVSMGVIRWIRR